MCVYGMYVCICIKGGCKYLCEVLNGTMAQSKTIRNMIWREGEGEVFMARICASLVMVCAR